MESYIVRIYRRITGKRGDEVVGTVEDVSRRETRQFKDLAELEKVLTPLPKGRKKKQTKK